LNNEMKQQIVALLPRLRRFAYGLAGDLDRADDLVQEACLRALANSTQWQPGTRLDSWMYRIVQNTWYDQLRARKVRGEVVDIEEQTHLVGTDGRDVLEHRASLLAVSKKLTELSADQQMIVALVCFDGLSYKEAAAALDLPIGTVMSRLARARIALAGALESTQGAGDKGSSGGKNG
jgi:RNA polymerase sigma-70 factor, ECF subfamily